MKSIWYAFKLQKPVPVSVLSPFVREYRIWRYSIHSANLLMVNVASQGSSYYPAAIIHYIRRPSGQNKSRW